jgi:hypothetical protein
MELLDEMDAVLLKKLQSGYLDPLIIGDLKLPFLH